MVRRGGIVGRRGEIVVGGWSVGAPSSEISAEMRFGDFISYLIEI